MRKTCKLGISEHADVPEHLMEEVRLRRVEGLRVVADVLRAAENAVRQSVKEDAAVDETADWFKAPSNLLVQIG